MMLRGNAGWALGLALLMGAQTVAQAALISQARSFTFDDLISDGVSSAVFGARGTESDGSIETRQLSFDLFDPGLGSLDAVTIQLLSDEGHSFGARARCSPGLGRCLSSGTGSVSSSHAVRTELVIDPGGLILTHSRAFFGNLECSFTKVGPFGPDRCTDSITDTNGISRTFGLTGDDADRFVGPGTFAADLALSAFTEATFTCVILNIVDCPNDARTDALWSGRMEVRYTYSEVTAPPPVTPVPEPGTIALLVLALAPLWALTALGW